MDALHLDSQYTPQMVVDGHTQFVGSDEGEADRAIAAAARAAASATRYARVFACRTVSGSFTFMADLTSR